MFALPKRPYKPREFVEARRMRREQGLPIKAIAKQLGVSPGTVHLWTADIQIAPEHVARNMHRARSASVETWVEKGVCTLSVCDTRIVQHIYGAIQEYAGFDEPRWLDCAPIKSTPS